MCLLFDMAAKSKVQGFVSITYTPDEYSSTEITSCLPTRLTWHFKTILWIFLPCKINIVPAVKFLINSILNKILTDQKSKYLTNVYKQNDHCLLYFSLLSFTILSFVATLIICLSNSA